MTFLAALRCDRIEAPWLLDGPINGESVRTYVEKVLVPTLAEAISSSSTISAATRERPCATIRNAGARLFFLPKYSPDLNPIEKLFAKLKHCCARPPSEPSTPSASQSANSSLPSPPRNAPTTSGTQVIKHKIIKL